MTNPDHIAITRNNAIRALPEKRLSQELISTQGLDIEVVAFLNNMKNFAGGEDQDIAEKFQNFYDFILIHATRLLIAKEIDELGENPEENARLDVIVKAAKLMSGKNIDVLKEVEPLKKLNLKIIELAKLCFKVSDSVKNDVKKRYESEEALVGKIEEVFLNIQEKYQEHKLEKEKQISDKVSADRDEKFESALDEFVELSVKKESPKMFENCEIVFVYRKEEHDGLFENYDQDDLVTGAEEGKQVFVVMEGSWKGVDVFQKNKSISGDIFTDESHNFTAGRDGAHAKDGADILYSMLHIIKTVKVIKDIPQIAGFAAEFELDLSDKDGVVTLKTLLGFLGKIFKEGSSFDQIGRNYPDDGQVAWVSLPEENILIKDFSESLRELGVKCFYVDGRVDENILVSQEEYELIFSEEKEKITSAILSDAKEKSEDFSGFSTTLEQKEKLNDFRNHLMRKGGLMEEESFVKFRDDDYLGEESKTLLEGFLNYLESNGKPCSE
ncbi:MAG: hypothetical protein ACJAW3_001471, partial [Lentimonas sp.]